MRLLLIVVIALVLLVGVQLLLTWLASRRRVRVGRIGGIAVLRLARGRNAVLGMLALGPAVMLGVLPLAMHERGAFGLAFSSAIALAAFAVSGYFFVAEARKRIRIDDFGMERIGVFTRRRVAWRDVEKIAYNPTGRWFFVLGKDGTRVWVYESYEGVGDFAELALRSVPPAVLAAQPYVREELEDLAAVV
jgi:predicted permease